jgi:hypothetical protein
LLFTTWKILDTDYQSKPQERGRDQGSTTSPLQGILSVVGPLSILPLRPPCTPVALCIWYSGVHCAALSPHLFCTIELMGKDLTSSIAIFFSLLRPCTQSTQEVFSCYQQIKDFHSSLPHQDALWECVRESMKKGMAPSGRNQF